MITATGTPGFIGRRVPGLGAIAEHLSGKEVNLCAHASGRVGRYLWENWGRERLCSLSLGQRGSFLFSCGIEVEDFDKHVPGNFGRE